MTPALIRPLDPDACYRALVSRDARFDGRFFTGVKTTGIYCRPVCPARTPNRANVVFFRCAAAAEEADFRPCRRCRPDAGAGECEWDGRSAIVRRAVRAIRDGALDRVTGATFAARFGLSERHLHRLFVAELGATPGAFARTRRLHLARRLLDETGLPMIRVALAAGFASVRRFNEEVRRRYGATPTELRSSSRGEPRAEEHVRLHLPYRPPLAWTSLLSYLAERATPGVETVADGVYRRVVKGSGATGILMVRHTPDRQAVRLDVPHALTAELADLVAATRHLFDLDADVVTIAEHLAGDPFLTAVIRERPGVRVAGAWDGFEIAVRTIVGQQVSVRAATTLTGRIVGRFGAPLAAPTEPGLTHAFPDAATLAAADLAELGLTEPRQRAIRALAEAVAGGAIALDAAADPDATRAALLALPGVGPWTADSVLGRALRDPDAFPAGDLALQRAVLDDGTRLTASDLASRAEPWRPWRAYAARYLMERRHTVGAGR